MTRGADELLHSARETARVGRRLGVARLNLHGTGLGEGGLPVQPVEVVTGAMRLKARDTLCRIADMADEEGVPFGRAEDTLALVSSVDHPRLRLNLDLYHAQIGEGNLIELCRRALPWIGEVQVADVPGRCEPGTGEISYPAIARALHAMGYRGPVGMEAFAQDEPDAALDAFVAAFTL
ncbi:TIM barrel protein [Paenirhodobacter populi]|uniref:TIM barrel protein n=1 Tax=Paenirhodobacter populi TaxID=2306993 RepID=UPI001F4E36F9|nr:TIM barrel protein [Sinirhodobacter populi]